jgi:hypothetical protein
MSLGKFPLHGTLPSTRLGSTFFETAPLAWTLAARSAIARFIP